MKIAVVYPPITKQGRYPLLGQNRQFKYSKSHEVRIYPMIPAMTATLLKENNNDVMWLDGINERLSMEEFNKRLFRFNPDLIVIETKAPIIKKHWGYVDFIKDKIKTKVILVGDHVSYFPEESFKKSNVDYVAVGGDYDVGVLKLVDSIKSKRNPPKGIWYKIKGKLKKNGELELVKDLDKLPFIDRELTNWKLYGEAYLYRPCSYIITGRGCGGNYKNPGVCTFCVWQHSLWKRTARLRSAKNVVKEIKSLVGEYKIKEIFDDNESGGIWNKKWLKEFYNEMKKEGLVGRVILSTNARADSLEDDTCKLLKKIGFRSLKIGVESGNDKTLKRICKLETIEQIKDGIKKAKDHGLNVFMTSMVGYPWEDEEDTRRTYLTLKELMLYKTKFGDVLQSSVIMPYPGTPLYEDAIKNNWLIYDKEDYERIDQTMPILKTKIDTQKWVKKIWGIYSSPRYVLKMVVSMRNIEDIKFLFRGFTSWSGHIRDY